MGFLVGGLSLQDRVARIEAALGINDDTSGLIGNALSVFNGEFHITKTSAAAYTLRAPVAGSVQNGGEDGNVLKIVSSTAFAHTLTTPSNKLNGNKQVGTFAAAVGNGFELHAKNGVWLVFANQGVTLT